jgi:hypothetical protein
VVVADTFDELGPALVPHLSTDALLLLKASRGEQFERLLPYIADWAGVAQTDVAPASH